MVHKSHKDTRLEASYLVFSASYTDIIAIKFMRVNPAVS
jgi:hypothetical protein